MSASTTIREWFTNHRAVSLKSLPQESNSVLETGDFRIDLRSRRAFLRDQQLDLSAAEFDLLQFLLSHPKKIVTSRTVLLSNHGEDALRRTDFVSTLLSLRNKIESLSASGIYLRLDPWLVYSFSPTGGQL